MKNSHETWTAISATEIELIIISPFVFCRLSGDAEIKTFHSRRSFSGWLMLIPWGILFLFLRLSIPQIIYEIFHLKIIVSPACVQVKVSQRPHHHPHPHNYRTLFARLSFENNATWKACYVCEIYAIWIHTKDFTSRPTCPTIGVKKGVPRKCLRRPRWGMRANNVS